MNHGVWEEISKNMLSTPYLKNNTPYSQMADTREKTGA